MSIAVTPSAIVLYPSDVQVFSAVPGSENTIWLAQASENVNILADGSLDLIVDANDGSGAGGQRLINGPGYLEWTIDAQCLPTTTGYLQIEIFHGAENFQVKIKPTQTDVSVVLDTAVVTHTVAAGDRFRIVIDGQRHLYINGVLKAETQPPFPTSNPTLYPVTMTAVLHPPMSASQRRIPPIFLSGNWPIRPLFVQWDTPPHGSISASSSGLFATYSNATNPGEYKLRAKINPTFSNGLAQNFDAIIFIPPLTVIGPLEVTLQPGEKVRFRTNYEDAQNPELVTWSESGAGSLDAAHVYTAPTAPTNMGSATVTASHGSQNVVISIAVPPVITPNYQAVAPSEVVDWETNVSSPTWTVSTGSINSSTGLWTAPSIIGQIVRITASGGGFSVFRDVIVYEKFPYDPNAVILVDVTRKVLISEAEDGSRAARVKNKGGGFPRKYDLTFKNRDLTELNAAVDFWQRNYPSRPIIFDDKVRGVRVVGYIDSDLHYEVGAACDIDYSFRFVEKA